MCLSRAPRCVNWEHGRVQNLINIVEIFIVSIYHRLIIFLSHICEPALSENDQNNFIIFALWALCMSALLGKNKRHPRSQVAQCFLIFVTKIFVSEISKDRTVLGELTTPEGPPSATGLRKLKSKRWERTTPWREAALRRRSRCQSSYCRCGRKVNGKLAKFDKCQIK